MFFFTIDLFSIINRLKEKNRLDKERIDKQSEKI